MKIAVYGPRPSIKMDDADKMTEEIIRFCARNKIEINIPLTLGYNLALINRMRVFQGGGFNIYSWGTVNQVIESWKDKETTKQVLMNVLLHNARRFVIVSPDPDEKRSRKIRKRNKMIADDSEWILVFSPKGKRVEIDIEFLKGYCEYKIVEISSLEDVLVWEDLVKNGESI